METYKSIDEFIKEVFPIEHEKTLNTKKSEITTPEEKLDSDFNEKLKEILKGKSE